MRDLADVEDAMGLGAKIVQDVISFEHHELRLNLN
jgi:hypothetical protein